MALAPGRRPRSRSRRTRSRCRRLRVPEHDRPSTTWNDQQRGMDEPDQREDRADERVDDRPAVLLVDDELPRSRRASGRPRPRRRRDRHPGVHARPARRARRSRPSPALVPAAPSAPSTWPLAHWAMFGTMASTIAGACSRRRRLERLRADDEADEQQDRERAPDRGMTARNRPTSPSRQINGDDDAGRERVADPAADGLPARMADVHRGRERAAEERADDGPDRRRRARMCAEVVVVAGRRGAFDVVHALGEVVDAERDRRDEQRQDVGQAAEHLACPGSGRWIPNWRERVRHGLRARPCPADRQVRHPADAPCRR